MMLGLPLDAWLLLTLAIAIGLGLELAFYRARRRDRHGVRAPPAAREHGSPGGDA